MFSYLCECIPLEVGRDLVRNSYNTVINYFNSTDVNRRILQQEKFHEDYDEQCGISVYEISKNNAVVLEQPHQQVPHTIIDEPQGFVYDPAWNNHQILQAKAQYDLRCLKSLFDMDPNDDGFEKIHEEESHNMKIFHKQLLIEQSKRINIYRYTFTLNVGIKEYLELFTTQVLNSLDSNLKSWNTLEVINEDLVVCHAAYKKVLIIPPKDFVFLYYQNLDESIQTFYQLGSSVQSSLPTETGTTRGIVHLSGYSVKEVSEGKVLIEAYANIDLDLKINPSMVKQPTKNQIKKYMQKIIKKSQQKPEPTQQIKQEQLLN